MTWELGVGQALAETLRLNAELTWLKLGVNRLGAGGVRELAEALRFNTNLASLDLAFNDLGDGGGQALAEALRLNTTLTALHLWARLERIKSQHFVRLGR